MRGLVLAMAVGLTIWEAYHQRSVWPEALGWMVALPSRNMLWMVWGMMAGWGWSQLTEAVGKEKVRDRDEQAAETFLMQLAQLLPIRGALGAALDDMGYRALGESSPTGVLEDFAGHCRVSALTMVSQVARRISRQGGSLLPVVREALRDIQSTRRARFERRPEEAAQRTTVMILGVAPVLLMAGFGLFLPTFYRALDGTSIGNLAVSLVGTSMTAVWWILAAHIERSSAAR